MKFLMLALVALTLLLATVLVEAADRRRPPIIVYANPAENPNLTVEQRDQIISNWVECVECAGSDIANIASFGNSIIELLEKFYTGNATQLRLTAMEQQLGNEYDDLSPFLTRPVNKTTYVHRQANIYRTRVRSRAAAVLIAIGSVEALAVLTTNERSRTP